MLATGQSFDSSGKHTNDEAVVSEPCNDDAPDSKLVVRLAAYC